MRAAAIGLALGAWMVVAAARPAAAVGDPDPPPGVEYTVTIYAPNDQLEFRRGCEIDARCRIAPAPPISLPVEFWVDNNETSTYDCEDVYSDPQGAYREYKIKEEDGGAVSTADLDRGGHTLHAKLSDPATQDILAQGQGPFRTFAMTWPEDGIIWGTCQGHINNGKKCGVDISFSETDHQPADVPTENPIWQAHGGEVDDRLNYDERGGYRFWVHYHQKVRVDLKTSPTGGPGAIPTYDEKFVFTYYCHLAARPDISKLEDNSGIGIWDSHLHFGVFLNQTDLPKGQNPAYDNDHASDPEAWLLPNPVLSPEKWIKGIVKNPDGTGVEGVKVYISARGHATTTGTGYYKCYVQPGTYTVHPVKQGLSFDPEQADVTVTAQGGVVQNFVKQ